MEVIPFSRVTTGPEEIEALKRVLESGWLAAGPETRAFEEEFAAYVGVKHAIFTNSCTSALKMAYKWYLEQPEYRKTTPGRPGFSSFRIIKVPRNTFCATYSAASEVGTEWGFQDSDLLGERVNMHYGGVKDETPCLIEDSAHRIEPNDPLVGRIRCYSFYATKNMTTGSGGMLVTNDDAIYERCRLYWRDGLSTSTEDRLRGTLGYRVECMAGGYDGNDMAAAVGRVQLGKIPGFTKRRNDVRDRYNEALGQSWEGNHLYPFLVSDEPEAYRCIAFMRERGVMCGHHYPGTGWNGVSLPIYPLLTDEEQERVILACTDYAAGVR